MRKTQLTLRLDQARMDALDKIAAGIERDRTYVVIQAIDTYLETQAWQIRHIEEAVRAADAGDFATDEEVDKAFTNLRGARKRKTA